MQLKEKVLIGMSGGVDSSVAAYMLKEQGYDVTGITLVMWSEKLYENRSDFGGCSSMSAAEDAKRVCHKLNIPHITLNMEEEFNNNVVNYFCNTYIEGKTPNPCIECNRNIKFGAMLDYALKNGFQYVATGHWAEIEYDESIKRVLLKKAKYDNKDQTYVLYTLTQNQLEHILMPLARYSKDEIRKIAEEKIGLFIAEKKDSMEICFIPDDDYISFIKDNTGYVPECGDFVDTKGNIIGKHSSIINFTIGQRKGLGMTFGKPMFVTNIDPETNRVTLGEKGEEYFGGVDCVKSNFIMFDTPPEKFECLCKTRYSAKMCPCTVEITGKESFKITFHTPQRAVTPGQSAVLYKDDSVIGGGTILKSY